MRELYRDVELPGEHPLDELQDAHDAEVRKAYDMKANADPLKHLFDLNKALAAREASGSPIVGPGLPQEFVGLSALFSTDCVELK